MALVMDGWKNLLVDNQDGIVTVTINRPKAMNAINMELMKELEAFFTGLYDAPEADVVILTGAGDKAFVAGADIKEMAVMDAHSGRDWALLGERVTSLIERAPQPVIAAVNGYALGGGCELALACDFRYASANAKLGQPEAKWGINACFGGTQRLARAVGTGMAKELLYTARFIDATEALRIGLVNRVLPDQASLMDAAIATAKEIQASGKCAVRYTKLVVNDGRDLDIDAAIAAEAQYFGLCFDDPEQKARMTAFMNKTKK